jgi:hypothetical protein
MIAYVAALRLEAGFFSQLDTEISPNLKVADWLS